MHVYACAHMCACRWDVKHSIKKRKKPYNHGEGLKTKLQNGGMLRQRTEKRGESETNKKGIQRECDGGKVI